MYRISAVKMNCVNQYFFGKIDLCGKRFARIFVMYFYNTLNSLYCFYNKFIHENDNIINITLLIIMVEGSFIYR